MVNANPMVLPGTYKLKEGDNANAFYVIPLFTKTISVIFMTTI